MSIISVITLTERPHITMDVKQQTATTKLSVGKCHISVDALLKTMSCQQFLTTTLFQRLCGQRMTCRESLKHTVTLRDMPK